MWVPCFVWNLNYRFDSEEVKRIEESESDSVGYAKDEVLVVPYESLTPVSGGNATQFMSHLQLFVLHVNVNVSLGPFQRTYFANADGAEIKELLDKLVVLKFNGTLGTELGFDGPK